jgi:DNA repair exonuclease SbcCD nuclease subunit
MFRQTKIALVSDLHFGVHQGNSVWHNISYEFAKWFRDELRKRKIQDIVICGDVNNDRNEISVHTLSIVTEIFKLWSDFNIKILIGNHDAYYKDRCDINSLSQFSGWSNIEIYDDNHIIEQFDKRFGFVPWSKDIGKMPKCDIIFGHFDISGFTMVKGKICADGIKSYDVLKMADLIISGHFHLKDERRFENGTILYLGCPYELCWNDYNTQKGFYTLDLETKQTEFIENTFSPKHKRIFLTELLAADGITSLLKNEIKGNIVKFIIDKEIKSDKIEMLIGKLSTFQPLVFNTEFNTHTNYITDDISLETAGVDILTTIHEFIDMLEIKNKDSVISHMDQLYKRIVS